MASLEVLGTEPQAGRLARLRSNTDRLVSALCKIHGLEVRSDRRSPIVHVGLAPSHRGETAYADAEKMLTDLARRCSDACRARNSRSVRDHRMSAAQLTMVIGAVVIITSTGASIEVKCMPAPEPM